jgi:trimethylamine:corrinoid methyltransferase-like protein
LHFGHQEGLSILEKHGAVVDHWAGIAKLPRNMVEEAIRLCPSSMLLKARDPKRDIHAEGDRVYFGPGTLPIKDNVVTRVGPTTFSTDSGFPWAHRRQKMEKR